MKADQEDRVAPFVQICRCILRGRTAARRVFTSGPRRSHHPSARHPKWKHILMRAQLQSSRGSLYGYRALENRGITPRNVPAQMRRPAHQWARYTDCSDASGSVPGIARLQRARLRNPECQCRWAHPSSATPPPAPLRAPVRDSSCAPAALTGATLNQSPRPSRLSRRPSAQVYLPRCALSHYQVARARHLSQHGTTVGVGARKTRGRAVVGALFSARR